MQDRPRFAAPWVYPTPPIALKHHPLGPARLAAIAAALLLLQACGSGGGGDATTPVPPPVVVKTTLSGSAATGAALVGATVRVKCVAGSGTATTASNGAYTVDVSGATLPCVVSATSSDNATVLHSLVDPGGGNTQTININPVTELLVARLAGLAPASFFSSFDATTAVRLTTANIDSATRSVVATLRQGGVDFSAVGNPITALLVAATANAPGNAYDQKLDALGARLRTAGTTLAQLASQVAASVASSNTAATAAVGLPPELLFQPAAPTCVALRSGTYRLINPSEPDADWATSLMQVNASTGVVTFRDGSGGPMTATGNCTFSANGGTIQVVVSQGGVMMWTSFATNLNRQVLAIAFPEQAVALTDLAGSWNALEFNNFQDQTPATPLWINSVKQGDFAADGRHQSMSDCQGLLPCTPVTVALGSARLSALGGLDYVNTDGSIARMFIYRPASGHPMLVMVRPNKIFLVGSLSAAASPRALGETYGFYGLSMGPNGSTSPTISGSDFRITAVDTTSMSYTRQQVSSGLSDVLTANRPRPGLLHRAAGTGQQSNGQTVNLSEFISMPLPGTGVIVSGGVTTATTRNQGNFGFSVTKF